MIPLRDSARSEHFPVVTVALIIVNLMVFLFEVSLGGEVMNSFAYVFGLVPANYSHHLETPLGYLPFITSAFLHGSWMHIIGNMWILWLFGDNVEDKMGRPKFLVFYLTCALIAALAHFFFNYNSTVPVVGASGAVAGVMGAYFLMFRQSKVLTFLPPFFLFNIPAWVFLGFWALLQLWGGASGLMAAGDTQSVAFWAHIGGFVAGMVLYRGFLRSSPIPGT